ncbi:MAG TPA: TMEM14 family protein [Verrucomicrobiae bacterium]|jgi:uncharacterized membrane protein (UPF0136 family)|nr:TMEM14 family protein [Verrucomicrobiae bacterium]
MSNASVTVLWVYIALLLAGGVMGFVKAKSKISLITSAAFAAALALCALGIVKYAAVAYGLIGLLAVVFIMRFAKGRKFMPAGFMVVLSLGALAALWLLR